MSHSIRENITQIRQEIGNAELVVVSKYSSIEELNQVYETNQRNFAENRVQELTKKKELMPDDIHWHMIGHLQTNKVKFIAPFIHLIQSVDRIKLIKEINKEAKKNNRVIPILFQASRSSFTTSKAEAKYSFMEKNIYCQYASPSNDIIVIEWFLASPKSFLRLYNKV